MGPEDYGATGPDAGSAGARVHGPVGVRLGVNAPFCVFPFLGSGQIVVVFNFSYACVLRGDTGLIVPCLEQDLLCFVWS